MHAQQFQQNKWTRCSLYCVVRPRWKLHWRLLLSFVIQMFLESHAICNLMKFHIKISVKNHMHCVPFICTDSFDRHFFSNCFMCLVFRQVCLNLLHYRWGFSFLIQQIEHSHDIFNAKTVHKSIVQVYRHLEIFVLKRTSPRESSLLPYFFSALFSHLLLHAPINTDYVRFTVLQFLSSIYIEFQLQRRYF